MKRIRELNLDLLQRKPRTNEELEKELEKAGLKIRELSNLIKFYNKTILTNKTLKNVKKELNLR